MVDITHDEEVTGPCNGLAIEVECESINEVSHEDSENEEPLDTEELVEEAMNRIILGNDVPLEAM